MSRSRHRMYSTVRDGSNHNRRDADMIYHTSPKIITEAKDGLFGEAICFAISPYSLSWHGPRFIYSVDREDFSFIEASHIFFDDAWELATPIVELIMDRFTVDADTARELLDQTTELTRLDVGEFDWDDDFWIQQQRYEAAKLMGYDGVIQNDEQGAMYMLSVEHIINLTPEKS